MTLTQHYPQLKKLPHWLTALLLVFLSIILADLLWMVLTPEDKQQIQIVSTQNHARVKHKQQPNYGKIIANQHLFGVVEKKVVVAPPPRAVKVATPKPPVVTIPKLNVKLFGIMSYSNKKSGYALLSYNRQAQAVYSVGEALDKKEKGKEQKVFIHSVSAEKVVISNHGQLEDFSLPKRLGLNTKGGIAIATNTSLNNPPTSASAAIKPRARTPNNFMFDGGVTAVSASPQPIKMAKSSQSTAFSIKNIAEFRDKVMADPSKLMEIATAQPYSKNGQILGFRLRPGKNRRAFRQLGLRNGDIVKDVNGIALDSLEKGIMLMSELAGASELNITVLRGKREVQLPTLHF